MNVALSKSHRGDFDHIHLQNRGATSSSLPQHFVITSQPSSLMLAVTEALCSPTRFHPLILTVHNIHPDLGCSGIRQPSENQNPVNFCPLALHNVSTVPAASGARVEQGVRRALRRHRHSQHWEPRGAAPARAPTPAGPRQTFPSAARLGLLLKAPQLKRRRSSGAAEPRGPSAGLDVHQERAVRCAAHLRWGSRHLHQGGCTLKQLLPPAPGDRPLAPRQRPGLPGALSSAAWALPSAGQ